VVLQRLGRLPNALLCDYRLPGDETGTRVIRRLRAQAGSAIPAALISGDTAPESLRVAKASGYPLLPKPVAPARLRALIEHLTAAHRDRRGSVADEGQGLAG
jgi:CheY-like chemotaxis protein